MLEKLYNYVFWYNHHESLWYAIERDSQLAFFNGHREDSVHFKSKDHSTLVELLTKDSLRKKYVLPTKKAKKK